MSLCTVARGSDSSSSVGPLPPTNCASSSDIIGRAGSRWPATSSRMGRGRLPALSQSCVWRAIRCNCDGGGDWWWGRRRGRRPGGEETRRGAFLMRPRPGQTRAHHRVHKGDSKATVACSACHQQRHCCRTVISPYSGLPLFWREGVHHGANSTHAHPTRYSLSHPSTHSPPATVTHVLSSSRSSHSRNRPLSPPHAGQSKAISKDRSAGANTRRMGSGQLESPG